MNEASPQKANAQKRPTGVAAKTIFQIKEKTGIRKILFIASPRKFSFTQTPTITPTSYPNKIYKNCCTPGKKAVPQHLKYSTHYSKIYKRRAMASSLIIMKVTESTRIPDYS